ncbi:MAG TPA: hypothetical protein VKS25_12720 [Solirubrobacteraceae bacterium]|nr:hypothetical protein [Solirubrobacteraceae bacterium]
MRIPRHSLARGAIVAAVAVTVALTASSLGAFPATGGSETSDGSAPAGGAELTHTDNLPVNATQGSIAVQPLSADDLSSFNAMIAAVVDTVPNAAKLSKKGQATLGCVLMSYLNIANQTPGHVYTFTDLDLQAAMLNICLQLAQSLPGATHNQARAAAATCGRIDAAVTVRITHSSSGYRVTTLRRRARLSRPGLNVTCRHAGTGLLIGVAPGKTGQTLPQAGAPQLGIAYSNPSKATVGIRTTFTAN